MSVVRENVTNWELCDCCLTPGGCAGLDWSSWPGHVTLSSERAPGHCGERSFSGASVMWKGWITGTFGGCGYNQSYGIEPGDCSQYTECTQRAECMMRNGAVACYVPEGCPPGGGLCTVSTAQVAIHYVANIADYLGLLYSVYICTPDGRSAQETRSGFQAPFAGTGMALQDIIDAGQGIIHGEYGPDASGGMYTVS